MFLKSSGWLVDVMRIPGRPHSSFTSGSRSTRLVSSGSCVTKHDTVILCVASSLSAFL